MKRGNDEFTILSDRGLTSKFINDVSAAADRHRNEFGFLAKSVYEEFCRRDCLHVIAHATKNGLVYAGHLIFEPRYPKASIIQMFTSPSYRRYGLASRLISNLKNALTEKGFTSLYARVAEDLSDANAFWTRHGFHIQRIANGGASRNRKILVRCHELDSPQLFPASGLGPDNPLGLMQSRNSTPLFLLDLNVLFDSVGPRRLRHNIASSLFQAERIGLCKLAISNEIREELARHAPKGKTDPMLEYAKLFPTLPLLEGAAEKKAIDELAEIIFPNRIGLSENDKSDLRHLATAIQHELTGLITSDAAILNASNEINSKFSIDVVSPEVFVVDGESIDEGSDFEAPSCSQIRLASVDQVDMPKIHQLLAKLGVSSAEAISGWMPMSSATTGRAVWAGEELVGYSSWSSDASSIGLFAKVALDESHAEALNAGRILLTYLVEGLPRIGPRQITLSLPLHQPYLRELAINIGFRGTANQQVLTKLFVGSVVTEEQWLLFRKNLTDKIGLRLPEKIPAYMSPDQQLEIFTPNGNRTFQSLDEIETLLSPVLLCMRERPAVITPIQKDFSEELLGHSTQMSFLPLRSASLFKEKHYLSAKKNLKHFKRGTLILFYESAKRGGRMSIVAIARCRHSYLRSEGEIETDDLEKSVLTRDSLKRIGKSNMKAVAVFDSIHVLKNPVPLRFLQKIGCGKDTDLISTRQISDGQLQAILKEALS